MCLPCMLRRSVKGKKHKSKCKYCFNVLFGFANEENSANNKWNQWQQVLFDCICAIYLVLCE